MRTDLTDLTRLSPGPRWLGVGWVGRSGGSCWEEIKELYRSWLLELWHGRLEVAEKVVTPDFVGHWPNQDVHGPAGVTEAIEQGRSPFADIAISLDVGPIADGDKVAAYWTFRATYQGGLPGARAPAGTRVAFSGIDVLRVDPQAGKFSEYWVVSDALGLMTQGWRCAVGVTGGR